MVLDGGLEILDKSDADSDALIQHAASILGVDLNSADLQYPGGANVQEEHKFTFRQQWVLRWITRKINSELQAASKVKAAASAATTADDDISKCLLYISNPRLWQLFVRVIDSIPDQTCAEILVERKFVPSLEQTIRLILQQQSRSSSSSRTGASPSKDDGSVITSHSEEEGVSRKRRRISPQTDSPRTALDDLYLCVLRASYAVASIFGRQDEGKDSTVSWSQSAKDSSSVLSAVLELLYQAQSSATATATNDSLRLLGQLCSFWDHRPLASSESARNEEVSLFYQRCLDPCLRLLDLITATVAVGTSQDVRDARDTLESLVAFNAVLPLRKSFLEKTAKSWKAQTHHLSWKAIFKVYNLFSCVIEHSHQTKSTAENMISVSWAKNASALYDIAIRLVPKTDLKKSQAEQPWLDALLVFLAYLVCPRLTKFEVVQEEVEVVDLVIPTELIDRPEVIDKLLLTAKMRMHRPSPQALSSLTYSVLTWDALEKPWSSIAGLLDLDADVLVSNSGIVTASPALDVLLRRLDIASVGREDYAIILNQIIKPMLHGHARSRALKQFISLWGKYLAEALRRSATGLPSGPELAAVLVWQDEDLFDTFREVYRLHGTAGLTKDLVSALQDDLQDLTGRIGSTLNTLANVAIVNVVIESIQSADIAPLDRRGEKAIAESLIAALQKRSDYQGQRWRLWKLCQCICRDGLLSELSQDISNVARGVNSTSLGDLSKLSSEDADLNNISAPGYREVLERFSCIASVAEATTITTTTAAAAAAATLTGPLAEEIAGLQLLLNSDIIARSLTSRTKVWNGRLEDLHSLPKLLSACLGVILARPRLLKLTPGLAKDIEHLCADEQGVSLLYEPFFEATSELGDLQGSGSSWLNEWLAMEDAGATDVSTLRKLWLDLTRFDCSRAKAQALGDKAFGLLKSFGTKMQVEALVYLAAAMERIGSKYAVPYTRAEAWADWLDLLDAFQVDYAQEGTKDDLQVARSFGKILRQVWDNCRGGAPARQDAIIKTLSSRSKDRATEEWPLPRAVSWLIAFEAVVPSLMEGEQTQKTKPIIRQFTNMSHSYLSQIVPVGSGRSDEPTEEWLVQAAVILEAILKVAPHWSKLDRVVQMREGALNLQSYLYSCQGDQPILALLTHVQNKCDQLCVELAIGIDPESLPDHLEAISLRRRPETWQELDCLGSRARSLVSRLDPEGRDHLLSLLSQSSQTVAGSEGKLGLLHPILVASVVLQTKPDQLATSQLMMTSLDRVACFEDASTAQDALQLALSIENARLVLDHLPEVVNQKTIDTLLGNLCWILSPRQSLKDPMHARLFRPDAVFDRICSLLNSLLSRYRRRLADRHHLVLGVTQGLLKCLFFPGASAVESKQAGLTTYSSSFFHSLPSWLTASEHCLGRGSAAKFSRLLSMICNPTVSAAKSARKRNHNELNDEIKRVKALAGQHMQYLVMEYARCSLDGEIKVEVKEKLLPGLYVVLDAMGREVMRAMNAAMDPSSRAIFKSLYDDWVRHGKWDNS